MLSTQTSSTVSFAYKNKLQQYASLSFAKKNSENQQLLVKDLPGPANYLAIRNFNGRKNVTTTVFIKNMMCMRCKIMVKALLKNMGLKCIYLGLGEVEIRGMLTAYQLQQLNNGLLKIGLELLPDRKAMLAEKIRNIIIETIFQSDDLPETKYSYFLTEELNYDYTYLSKVFIEVQGISIEQFFIHEKVERVKELLIQGGFSLSEIAWNLHFSSVAHLSNQFKKITGLRPSQFKTTNIIDPCNA